MKTIEELIQKAVELQAAGLLTHAKKGDVAAAPRDIYIDWSNIGRSSTWQRLTAGALTDMILDCLAGTEQSIDVVIGVALSGIPLAGMNQKKQKGL